jgi:hypothetical protein
MADFAPRGPPREPLRTPGNPMAERTRNRRNTLERRCLPKTFKRMFAGSSKGIFKMLEKVKRVK